MEISCVICGEPWPACLSDMRPWEAALFRKGSGCPSCEGQSDLTEDHRLDIIGRRLTVECLECGDLELVALLTAWPDPPPPWERPTDPVLWQCDHCDITSYRDIDDDEPYFRRALCIVTHFNPDDDPISIDGQTLCSDCVSDCDECGETFHTEALWGIDGDYNRAYCQDCHGIVEHREHCEWIREECERIADNVDLELNDEFCPGTVWTHLSWDPQACSPSNEDVRAALVELEFMPTWYDEGEDGYAYVDGTRGTHFVLAECLLLPGDGSVLVWIDGELQQLAVEFIARIDGNPVDFSEPTPQAQEALPFAS